MKNNRFAPVILLICFFLVSAATAQTAKPNDSNRQDGDKSKTRQILSFQDSEEMFKILDGKWIFMETDCRKAFTVKVADDRKTIKFTYPKAESNDEREYVFIISKLESYYIRGQYKDEKRLDADGKPQVWDFMFLSKDAFIWHRTDWKAQNSTSPVIRCKEEKDQKVLAE